MPLLARTIVTPLAVDVRPGAVSALGPLLSDGRISTGGKVAVAVGSGRGDQIAAQIVDQLPQASMFTVTGGSIDAALELIAQLRRDSFDAVVGIGGGRTLDVAKYAASMTGLPFVSVATTLTHDGIASPVASLESHGRKASFGVHVPIAVFVDIDHVRDAPIEHQQSGVGDVLSNLNAIDDWYLAYRERDESVDGLAVSMARTAAEAMLATVPGTDRYLTVLAEGLILSGLAMSVAGTSRPCSGACHEISHALDMLLSGSGLHGLQVALGARFATWLRGNDEEFARLDEAWRLHSLPRVPGDLGLSLDTFAEAVALAPSTRPDRYTILEHLELTPQQIATLVKDFDATVS